MPRIRSHILLGLTAALAVGCGASSAHSGATTPPPAARAGTVEAQDPEARAVLGRLDEIPEGTPEFLHGGGQVLAGAAYLAASGRRCRGVSLRTDGRERALLACRDANHWFFVPDVAPTAQRGGSVARPPAATASVGSTP